MRFSLRSGSTRLLSLLLLPAIWLLAGCATESIPEIVSNSPVSVSIAALPSDDLVGACTYDLLLQEPDVTQAGTLVVFERGDSALLYAQPSLRALAKSLHFAMLWAHQCNSRSNGDIQGNAAAGPSRTLVAAMTQLATNNNHPELATGGMILYGFSAAGVLSATLAEALPTRVWGTIVYAPGDAYFALQNSTISAAAAAIPSLILGNADDTLAGTWVGFSYFKHGRRQDAPWAYAVQNATTHCCTLSTIPLIEPWISAVAMAHASPSASGSEALATAYPGTVWGAFTCTQNGVLAGAIQDCGFTNVSVLSQPTAASAWLPNQAFATAWLAWTSNPQTN